MATAPTYDEALTPNDAIALLETLLPAQNQSYLLGLKLGLPVHVVDAIFTTHTRPRERLLHIIIAFLDESELKPTWRVIVSALRSPAVGLTQLASKVEASHSPNPTAVREVMRDINNTCAATGNAILALPLSQPSSNGHLAETKRPVSPINPVTSDYVQAKIREFERRFNGMKRASRNCLEKRKISVKKVTDALMDLPTDDMEEHKHFLESHLSVLYQANDQSELFGALSFNMNYLSYQLLDYLMSEFELEVREEMEVYKVDLKRFRDRTPLVIFYQTQKKRYVEPPSRFQEVVAKFEWPLEITLEVVEQFRQEYACHYNLRECAMMLAEIRPGSFIVAWFIPKCITEKLKSNIPKYLLERYATAELIIAGVCVYTSNDPQMAERSNIMELPDKESLPKDELNKCDGEELGPVSSMRKVSQSSSSDVSIIDGSSDSEDKEFHLTDDDCFFVGNPPNHELFCPVTTDLLLHPHLTSCCGNHLSREAAVRIKEEKRMCPFCNTEDWDTMLNKRFQRQICSLRMLCRYQERGCWWQGELVQLELHVRSCGFKHAPLTKPGYYLVILPTSDNEVEELDSDTESTSDSDESESPLETMEVNNPLQIQQEDLGDPRDNVVSPETPTEEENLLQMLEHLRELANERSILIPKHHIQLGKLAGEGETGLVYSGYIHGEFVAIKTSKVLSSIQLKKQLIKEATIMVGMSHPNVMKLEGISLDGDMPLLIMPFMTNGTLLQYVRRYREQLYHTKKSTFYEKIEISRKRCLDMCYQIAKGMTYIISHDYIHRDLAARNCMVGADGNIKVCDFGMAEDTSLQPYYKMDTEREERVPVRWVAPESIEERIFTEKTDVWSYGVTCWEVFTCGKVPYVEVPTPTLVRQLRNGLRLERPQNIVCSDKIWSIMKRCWEEDHAERPSFASLTNILFELMSDDPAYVKLSTIP